jgi:hypothetical protein
MTNAQRIASQVIQFVSARCNVNVNARKDISDYVESLVRPLDPVQMGLSFEDAQALAGQREEILKLLRQRRSSGAANFELCEIGLNYRARVSELRQEGYQITATRQSGRTFLYTLHSASW